MSVGARHASDELSADGTTLSVDRITSNADVCTLSSSSSHGHRVPGRTFSVDKKENINISCRPSHRCHPVITAASTDKLQ